MIREDVLPEHLTYVDDIKSVKFSKTSQVEWPKHKAALRVSHNQHWSYYKTAGQAFDEGEYDFCDITPEERSLCIESDSVWTIQWYPRTPIGFEAVAASTFDRALAAAIALEQDCESK